jgi:hypothetical protein
VKRDNLVSYLLHARKFDYADNNWKFFRVLVDIALDRLGIEHDRSLTKAYLAELDGFYIGDGWYRDGNVRRVDHYIAFAMHFYGLIYARLVEDDHAKRYRERAVAFAQDFRHWFADDGATLPFGRSLTYRFACAGFWAGTGLCRPRGAALGRDQGALPAPPQMVGRQADSGSGRRSLHRLRLSEPPDVGKLQFGRFALLGLQGFPAAWPSARTIPSGRARKSRRGRRPSR